MLAEIVTAFFCYTVVVPVYLSLVPAELSAVSAAGAESGWTWALMTAVQWVGVCPMAIDATMDPAKLPFVAYMLKHRSVCMWAAVADRLQQNGAEVPTWFAYAALYCVAYAPVIAVTMMVYLGLAAEMNRRTKVESGALVDMATLLLIASVAVCLIPLGIGLIR
jgi:hypothetical protein